MSKSPIYPVRFTRADHFVVEQIRKKYGLKTKSETLRLALRFMTERQPSPYTVKMVNRKYENDHPEASTITVVNPS